MESVKDILNFCNAAVFYDYTNVGITCEVIQVRKCIIKSFFETIPHSRTLVNLFIIHDVILKTNKNDIENIIEIIHDLGEYILYMLSFKKMIRDEQQTVRPILNDNDE